MTGQQAKAQAMMLGILENQVGGAGGEGAGGLAGAFDTLGENINLFFEKSLNFSFEPKNKHFEAGMFGRYGAK